jgi:hypothetical protein
LIGASTKNATKTHGSAGTLASTATRKQKTEGPYGSLFKASQKMVMLQLENILFPVVFVHLKAGFLCGEPRLGRLLFADEGGP